MVTYPPDGRQESGIREARSGRKIAASLDFFMFFTKYFHKNSGFS